MKPGYIVKNLHEADKLIRVTQRMFSGSRIGSYAKDDSMYEKNFKFAFQLLIDEFSSHRAVNHPLFQYLKDKSQQDGFNSRQFQIYRDNFFCRTELTIPSVARLIEKAALEGDINAMAETTRNLYDECGHGDPEKIHSKLLLDSHNQHGEKVFGLETLKELKDARKSKLLLPAVLEYRKSKTAIFNRPYPYIAGNTWAHELAADKMLISFREAFFEPYKGYYTQSEYKKLVRFYEVHRDDSIQGGDVEVQHEIMSRAASERICKENMVNIPKVKKGGLEFLEKQAELWDQLQQSIENAQEKGVKISPKRDHMPEIVGKFTATKLKQNDRVI